MKECRDIRELLSAYIDQSLTEAEQARLEDHLADCRRCREALEELKRTVKLVKGVEEVEPPPWLTTKIMARIEAEAAPKPSVWSRLFTPLMTGLPIQAVALVVLCVTGYFLAKTMIPQVDLSAPVEQEQKAKAPQPTPAGEADRSQNERKIPATATVPAERKEPLSLPHRKGSIPETILRVPPPAAPAPAPVPAFVPPPPTAAPPAERYEEYRLMEKRAREAQKAAEGEQFGSAQSRNVPMVDEGFRPTGRAKKGVRMEMAPSAPGVSPKRDEMSRFESMPSAPRMDVVTVRMHVPDPAVAGSTIAEELRKAGAVVIGTPTDDLHLVRARIDSARLPELLERLVRIGTLRDKPVIPTIPTPSITLIISW